MTDSVNDSQPGRAQGPIIFLVAIAFLAAVLWWVLSGMPSRGA